MAKAYLGSTQLKKAYIGSTAIKKIYHGSILIWSGYQDETLAQKVRIEADGGTVIDLAWIDLVISTLKALGIYSNAKLLTDANFGVRKDITGAVSKLYDISGNNNDAVQTTGASQPIWSLVNGKGIITYDGSNDFMSVSNFSLNTYMTIYVSGTFSLTKPFFIEHGITANTIDGFYFYGTVPPFVIRRTSIHRPTGVANWFGNIRATGAATYNGGILFYKNGNTQANGTITGTPRPNTLITQTLYLFSRAGSSLFSQGTSENISIFDNIVLTQSQIVTLYNLGL